MGEVTSAVIATSLVLDLRLRPRIVLSRNHRHPVPAVRPDHCLLDRDLGLQRADPLACARCAHSAPGEPKNVASSVRSTARIHRTTQWYGGVAHRVVRLRYAMLVVFFAGLGATVYMYRTRPHRLRSHRRPELSDLHRADSAGRIADLHQRSRRPRDSGHSPEP